PLVSVYWPDGSLPNGNYSQAATDVAAVGFPAPQDGTYTVVVSDGPTGHAEADDYKLDFTKGPGANENGVLRPGGVVTGHIDEGELDSYTFSANAGEGIAVRVTDLAGGPFTPLVSVYWPDGSLPNGNYSQAATDVAGLGFAAPQTGTYTVVVS